MLYTPSRSYPSPRHEAHARRLQRAGIVGIAAAFAISAFAVGAATQRVENNLARTDQCVRASNTITCLIVLDEVLDVVEPPRA